MTVECPMSQHYALGQEVYFRLTDKEMPKEGKLVSVGDAFTVKLENGDTMDAQLTQLAPNFGSREDVIYTSKEGKESGARVLSIDIAFWPPSYSIKEDKGKTRETEGFRLILSSLAEDMKQQAEMKSAKDKADAMMAALLNEEESANEKEKKAKAKVESKAKEAKEKAAKKQQSQAEEATKKRQQAEAEAAAAVAAEEEKLDKERKSLAAKTAAMEAAAEAEAEAEAGRKEAQRLEKEAKLKAKKAEKKAEKAANKVENSKKSSDEEGSDDNEDGEITAEDEEAHAELYGTPGGTYVPPGPRRDHSLTSKVTENAAAQAAPAPPAAFRANPGQKATPPGFTPGKHGLPPRDEPAAVAPAKAVTPPGFTPGKHGISEGPTPDDAPHTPAPAGSWAARAAECTPDLAQPTPVRSQSKLKPKAPFAASSTPIPLASVESWDNPDSWDDPAPTDGFASAPAPTGGFASAPAPTGGLASAPAPTGGFASAPAPIGGFASAPAPVPAPIPMPASSDSWGNSAATDGFASAPAPVPAPAVKPAPAVVPVAKPAGIPPAPAPFDPSYDPIYDVNADAWDNSRITEGFAQAPAPEGMWTPAPRPVHAPAVKPEIIDAVNAGWSNGGGAPKPAAATKAPAPAQGNRDTLTPPVTGKAPAHDSWSTPTVTTTQPGRRTAPAPLPEMAVALTVKENAKEDEEDSAAKAKNQRKREAKAAKKRVEERAALLALGLDEDTARMLRSKGEHAEVVRTAAAEVESEETAQEVQESPRPKGADGAGAQKRKNKENKKAKGNKGNKMGGNTKILATDIETRKKVPLMTPLAQWIAVVVVCVIGFLYVYLKNSTHAAAAAPPYKL